MGALLKISGTQTGEIPFLEAVVIGRDAAACDCILTHDGEVSRVHARVIKDGDAYALIDENSRNGTFLNNKKVTGKVPIRSQDVIRVGQTFLRFTIDGDETAPISGGLTAAPEEPAGVGSHTIFASLDASLDPFANIAPEKLGVEKLKKANDRMRILHSISKQFTGVRTMPRAKLLADLLDKLFEVMPVQRGAILLKGKDGQFRPEVQRNKDLTDQSGEMKVSRSILQHVLEKQQAVLSQDATQDQNFNPGKSILIHQIRSVACVPMLIKRPVEKDGHKQEVNDIIGIIQVYSTQQGTTLEQDDLDLLVGIAGIAGLAINNTMLVDQLLGERERRTKVETNLSRYMNKHLVEQILSEQVQIQLYGQEKRITVLFSDIRGFTTMSQTVNAVEVVKTLNAYFSQMVEIIFEQKGTLDKFIGDAIMALWGAMLPEPEQEVKAVTAAVKMQRELNLMNLLRRGLGQAPLFMGVGLHTGDAVVGNMGSMQAMQFTAMGPTVNLASRIEGQTKKHMVLLSRQTYDVVKDHVVAHELPAVRLKGIEEPVPIFTVIGMKADPVPPAMLEPGEDMAVALLVSLRMPGVEQEVIGRCFEMPQDQLIFRVEASVAGGLEEGGFFGVEVPLLDGSGTRSLLRLIATSKSMKDGFVDIHPAFVRKTQPRISLPQAVNGVGAKTE